MKTLYFNVWKFYLASFFVPDLFSFPFVIFSFEKLRDFLYFVARFFKWEDETKRKRKLLITKKTTQLCVIYIRAGRSNANLSAASSSMSHQFRLMLVNWQARMQTAYWFLFSFEQKCRKSFCEWVENGVFNVAKWNCRITVFDDTFRPLFTRWDRLESFSAILISVTRYLYQHKIQAQIWC